MSRRPWLSFGFFLPLLAALALVVGVACGEAADPTATPEPTAMAEEPTAMAEEPTAMAEEPTAMAEEPTAMAEEPTAMAEEPTATAAPQPTPTEPPATEPPMVTVPTGTLNVARPSLGAYSGSTRYWSGSGAGLGTTAELHEGLFRLNRETQYEKIMVEDWSLEGDLVWTFTLKEGVPFHPDAEGQDWGTATAEDVVYALTEMVADDSGCSCTHVQSIFVNPEGSFKALDELTVELNTGTPNWEVLDWFMTPGSGHVFSKAQWESLAASGIGEDAAAAQLVGTGPFALAETELGLWTLNAVEGHYRKTPEFAELRFLEIPEEATALAAFQTGRIDTWSAALDSLPTLAQDADTKFMSVPAAAELVLIIFQNGYTYVDDPDIAPGDNPYTRDNPDTPDVENVESDWQGYNGDLPWVASDPEVGSDGWERARKVREAISIAIDREKLVEELLYGEGHPSSVYGWARHQEEEPDDWAWEYNPGRAMELLAEAGYADGFDVTLVPVASTVGGATTNGACVAMANMLQDVGINATLQNVPVADLYGTYKNRTAEGIMCQYNSRFGPEPIWLHRYAYSPTGAWGTGWDHPDFTPPLREASATIDPEERWRLQTVLGKWMRDNALAVSVFAVNTVFPLGPKVDSWEQHLSQGLPSRVSGLEFAKHRQ